MTPDQPSPFEAQAKRVGRATLPPEWRSEILEAALGGTAEPTTGKRSPITWLRALIAPGGNDITPATQEADTPQSAVVPFKKAGSPPQGHLPAANPQSLEERIRKAERRAMWSMAACFLATLLLAALLLRPRLERPAGAGWSEQSAPRRLAESERDGWESTVTPLADNSRSLHDDFADIPPPPAPEQAASEPSGAAGGALLHREADANDVFDMLAKRSGKQYFRNSRLAGSEFSVNGALADGDPEEQLKELAARQGLTIYEKDHTLYALTEEQADQLADRKKELSFPLRHVKPDNEEQVEALLNPILSPNGTARYDSESRTVRIADDAHLVERARDFLTDIDNPAATDTRRGEPAPERSPIEAPPVDEYWAGQAPLESNGRLGGEPAVPEPAAKQPEEADFSIMGRAPIVTTTINETEVGNQVTEEVRYQVDTRDPVNDPATTREIGVTLAVTPTLLPDDTIRMKMRPRSAQIVDEIIGQSGNRYPRVSEAMLEQIARIPDGHSLVIGGFYGQAKSKDEKKTPLFGDTPQIGLFFKDKEAAQEKPDLVFVATPTVVDHRVVVETKILDVNNSVGGRGGVDWNSDLGSTGLPQETIGSLNSLFGLKAPDNPADGAVTAGDAPIVLSPEQTEGVLRTLAEGGLVTQTSNPTLVTGDNEQATLSLIDRVPIITTTIRETAAPPLVEEKEWSLPLHAWGMIRDGKVALDGKAPGHGLPPVAGGAESDPEKALRTYGVTFPEGTVLEYSASTGRLVAKNTAENLERIESLVQEAIQQQEREQLARNNFESHAGAEPYSTFSLHVSDVSFKLAQAALERGEWPAAQEVRVEEFVNAFDYCDPAPTQADKVSCRLEQAAHPFLQQRNLLRVSLRTAALGRSAGTPLRLTILLDKSGSMDRLDRVDSVMAAFKLLATQLDARDQVTLIGFSRTPRLLADRMQGDQVAELARLVESTPSGGGTNLEEALQLGIAKAKEQWLPNGQNRVILLTDGAVNLGNAQPESLSMMVEEMRREQIAFDACGVGADGLNDQVLEALTRKGDGRYYFLDRPEDADDGFARQIAGALRPAARNVKVQMRFNPNRVAHYRLYGFEKHLLKKEDFRDDSVDAAELAAEEAGNALYHLEVLPEGSGDIGSVSVRFQDAESGQMIEREWTIPYESHVPRLEEAAPSLRLASGAALLGEELKGSVLADVIEMRELSSLINGLGSTGLANQRVQKLAEMANRVRALSGE